MHVCIYIYVYIYIYYIYMYIYICRYTYPLLAENQFIYCKHPIVKNESCTTVDPIHSISMKISPKFEPISKKVWRGFSENHGDIHYQRRFSLVSHRFSHGFSHLQKRHVVATGLHRGHRHSLLAALATHPSCSGKYPDGGSKINWDWALFKRVAANFTWDGGFLK